MVFSRLYFFLLIIIFSFSLYSQDSQDLKEVFKNPFDYQSKISKNEIKQNEKIFITNQVTLKNIPVAGKAILVKIIPPLEERIEKNQEQKKITFSGVTDEEGEWELSFEKTALTGEYLVTTIFLDNKKTYQQHIIQQKFKVINSKKIQQIIISIFAFIGIVFFLALFFWIIKKDFLSLFYFSPIFYFLTAKKTQGLFFIYRFFLLLFASGILLLNNYAFFFFYLVVMGIIFYVRKTAVFKIILMELIIVYLVYFWLINYQDYSFLKNWPSDDEWVLLSWLFIFIPTPFLFLVLAFIVFFTAPIFLQKMLLISVVSTISIVVFLVCQILLSARRKYF